MEKVVDRIVFRRLTDNDFDKIYQEGSAYAKGGGQSYIDFPTGDVPLAEWNILLGVPTETRAGGRSAWTFEINSFGMNVSQDLTIAHRRDASISITSQKIVSRESNRVPSWHPDNGFPDQVAAGRIFPLIYIVKTTDGEYWAGWTDKNAPVAGWKTNTDLNQFFVSDEAGVAVGDGSMFIETSNRQWPFYFKSNAEKHHTRSEEEVTEIEFEGDILEDVESLSQEEKDRVVKIKARNTKIVRNLKKLYDGRCQISGEELTFPKKDGKLYSEAHHLIALGDGGSDDYRNIIIISPLIHRMLHYAKVSGIDLSKIKNNRLTIQINDTNHVITWHPEHARTVNRSVESEAQE